MTSDEFYLRLVKFAQQNNKFLKTLPISTFNKDYVSQLIRSSSSIGANYIEALEAISKKDFIHRLKICRKETRESVHWLILIKGNFENNAVTNKSSELLIKEAQELIRIFTSSILTAEKNQKISQ